MAWYNSDYSFFSDNVIKSNNDNDIMDKIPPSNIGLYEKIVFMACGGCKKPKKPRK